MSKYGWKFLREDRCSSYGDEPPWSEGETRTLDGEIVLYERGYHDSPTVYDALTGLVGPILARTKSSGKSEIDTTPGKAIRVSESLTILAIRDVSRELRLWGCDCAERVLIRVRDAGRKTDERSWQAITVARRFANGEASTKELAEACDAAWAVTREFGWAASGATTAVAARAAAWAATKDSDWAAVMAASWAGTKAPLWDAARAAEIAWQRQHLDELILPLFAGGAVVSLRERALAAHQAAEELRRAEELRQAEEARRREGDVFALYVSSITDEPIETIAEHFEMLSPDRFAVTEDVNSTRPAVWSGDVLFVYADRDSVTYVATPCTECGKLICSPMDVIRRYTDERPDLAEIRRAMNLERLGRVLATVRPTCYGDLECVQ